MCHSWRRSFFAFVLFAPGLLAAQSAPDDYALYRTLSADGDSKGLNELAIRLAGTENRSAHHLALLCSATSAFRSDAFAESARWLDSLGQEFDLLEPRVAYTWVKWKAMLLDHAGHTTDGLAWCDKLLADQTKAAPAEERVDLQVTRGELLDVLGHGARSIEQLGEAERAAHAIKYARGVALARLNLGNHKFTQGRYEEAAADYRAALREALTARAGVAARNAASNIAAVAVMQQDFDEALALHDSLIGTLGTRPSILLADLLSSLGYVHANRGDTRSAIAAYDRSLSISAMLHDKRSETKTLQHYAGSLWTMGRKEQALSYLHVALERAEEAHDTRAKAELRWELYERARELKRYEEALDHLSHYADLADSVNSARFKDRLAFAEVEHETERKEHRIAEQERALVLAAVEDRRKNIQRMALVVVVVAITLIALLLWRGLRARKRMAAQERELHQQRVDELMQRNEIDALNAMMEGQEKERDRLAKDLHDRLGSMLSAIKHQVGALEGEVQQVRQDQRTQYGKVNRLLDEAVGEVRRISHDMITVTLARFGLTKALEDLCDSVRVHGRLAVELNLHGLEQRMERSREITVYRIIQELISNVLKHAQASELSVGVTREPGRLSVIVTDDGRGFDPKTMAAGIGLDNVRARAASIGALVRIDSAPGRGTTVSVEGPVVE